MWYSLSINVITLVGLKFIRRPLNGHISMTKNQLPNIVETVVYVVEVNVRVIFAKSREGMSHHIL